MSIEKFIKKRPYLTWDTKAKLSDSAIVERVLNYGDFKDFKRIVKILSIKKVASIFRRQIKNKRHNYSPKIKNYFTLYFDKYA